MNCVVYTATIVTPTLFLVEVEGIPRALENDSDALLFDETLHM